MRASEDIASALEAHGNAVWRACALYSRSSPDAEDAYQETFRKNTFRSKKLPQGRAFP